MFETAREVLFLCDDGDGVYNYEGRSDSTAPRSLSSTAKGGEAAAAALLNIARVRLNARAGSD